MCKLKLCKLYHLHILQYFILSFEPISSSYILFFSSPQDAPHSTAIAVFPGGEVSEGGSVTLTCTSNAAPPVESFAWFKGTGPQYGDT